MAGKYNMTPTMRLVNNLEAGHIAGNLDASFLSANCAAESNLAIYAYEGFNAVTGDEGSQDAPVASSLVDDLYNYEIGFLTEGEYTLALTCNAEADNVEVAGDELSFVATASVTVSAEQTVTFDFVAQ